MNVVYTLVQALGALRQGKTLVQRGGGQGFRKEAGLVIAVSSYGKKPVGYGSLESYLHREDER